MHYHEKSVWSCYSEKVKYPFLLANVIMTNRYWHLVEDELETAFEYKPVV